MESQKSINGNLWNLDTPLLRFSQDDVWRIRDACEGVQVFGATGSGKSSGSGQALAKSFLRAGFGGLVLTAKPEERGMWQRYCNEVGREKSLIIFSPSEPFRFNFMDYELKRPGSGAGLTENMVSLFTNVMEIAERNQSGGGGDDSYWQRTLKQLLRNTIDLLSIAKGTISLPDMYQVITSAPQNNEQLRSEAWQQKSFCYQCIGEADEREKNDERKNDFEHTARFWLGEFPNLSEKTRSIIVSMFTSMADMFLRGKLRTLFCTTTNVVPELTHEGAIIILDLPVKEHNELGQYAQVLFKYLWQHATERRDVNKHPTPVFLWADESQNFVTSYDMQFQTTARSSRVSTVYLTQNISNYYAALGGDMKAHAEADSLLGNFQTKIFHANGDHPTNVWAADLFAKSLQTRKHTSSSHSAQFGVDVVGRHYSEGSNQVVDYDVFPQEFTMLRKGGPDNDLSVDGFVFQGGRRWSATSKNYLKTTFRQNLEQGVTSNISE